MEDETIPKIKFKNKSKMEFEVLQISNVFKRYQNGDFKYEIQKFHRPQFNMILLVKNDNAKHFVDFASYDLQENDILFVGDNHVHAFSLSHPIDGTAVLFTSDFVGINETGIKMSMLKDIFKIPVINKLGENNTIRELISIIENEYTENKSNLLAFYKYTLLSIILRINFEIDKNDTNKPEKERRYAIGKLNKLIEDSFYRCRDSKIYAKMMGYSYKQLNIICKSVTGHTLKHYIDDYISLEMKRQIIATEMTLKELCVFFDFDEETNLAKYFKKHAGLSPKKFREQYENFRL